MASSRENTRFFVATDIASRGIDVKGIELVLNFDLPQSADDYVHRIGRTARAGAGGQGGGRRRISHVEVADPPGRGDSLIKGVRSTLILARRSPLVVSERAHRRSSASRASAVS